MVTSLTFGKPLKFGPNSYQTSKGRPTFLHTRESIWSPMRTTRIAQPLRGASKGPRMSESIATVSGWVKAPTILQLRPSIDRLATPLGINESLAFRAFDKTIIFGHWLSKILKLALTSGAFLFEKGFYYILVDYFQESKKRFPKMGEVFSWGFTAFLTCFTTFLTCFIAFLHMQTLGSKT